MTEREWSEGALVRSFLETLAGCKRPISDRKLRLFACAAGRLVWKLLADQRSKHAIETAELFADGLATESQLRDAHRQAGKLIPSTPNTDPLAMAVRTAYQAAAPGRRLAGVNAVGAYALALHIFGDPLDSPFQPPLSWPSPVVHLADALYNGQERTFALHDALLETGHPDLAEHFRDAEHPKGCWVLDLILRKG